MQLPSVNSVLPGLYSHSTGIKPGYDVQLLRAFRDFHHKFVDANRCLAGGSRAFQELDLCNIINERIELFPNYHLAPRLALRCSSSSDSLSVRLIGQTLPQIA